MSKLVITISLPVHEHRYTNWDSDMTTECICDIGYFGADCSLRMCPKGADPLVSGQQYRYTVAPQPLQITK
jgi:hypothetical protein